MTRRCPIDVFRYLDYRAFLAAYYSARKRQGYSYRAFSRSAKLTSPNYLKLVIQGKRNLTPSMAARFAQACRLHGEASEYFQQLVGFNQAKTPEERSLYYERMHGLNWEFATEATRNAGAFPSRFYPDFQPRKPCHPLRFPTNKRSIGLK